MVARRIFEVSYAEKPRSVGRVVRVGAPILPSGEEIKAYRDREDAAFRSLEDDMNRNLVWEDPDILREQAKTFRDLAATVPPFATDEQKQKYVDAQNAVADSFEADANRLEARMSGRSAARVLKEENWSRRYRDFMTRWSAFLDKAIVPSLISKDWSVIDQFDAEYRQFYATYQSDLGLKPSAPLPPTPEQIEAAHGQGQFPWTLAIGAVALAAVAFVAWKVL